MKEEATFSIEVLNAHEKPPLSRLRSRSLAQASLIDVSAVPVTFVFQVALSKRLHFLKVLCLS